MLHQHWAIVLVGWALSGLPTLCVAGVLQHPCTPHRDGCEQASAPDCPHNDSEHSHDTGCPHESDCGADPCSGSVLRIERPAEHELPIGLVIAVACPLQDHSTVPALIRAPSDRLHRMMNNTTLHPSDFPRLI